MYQFLKSLFKYICVNIVVISSKFAIELSFYVTFIYSKFRKKTSKYL